MIRTLQTRRYQLIPEVADEFVAWWSDTLVGLRESAGFTVEFASYDPMAHEFLWGVSAPGDQDEFLALEQQYVDSPPAVAAFEHLPVRVVSRDLHFSHLLVGRSQTA